MFYCASIKRIKKAVMLSALFMLSTLLQAEASDNLNTSDSAAKAETGLKSAADDQSRDFIFPDWPERKQFNRQKPVPPPPPGPYMSSALSDFSVIGASFGGNYDSSGLNKPAAGSDPSNIPMVTFSPDRPWIDPAYRKHKHSADCPPACSPQRWKPEDSYQYAPLVKKKSYPAVPNRMPGRMSGRVPGQYMPDMNWPGSQLPSRGSAPNGAYPYAPNYAPRYNAPPN